MRFVGFIGPSYKLSSVNVDCQRCINLYPEIDELGTGKEHEVAALVSTPGLRLLLTLPVSPVRGLFMTSKGQLFAVGNNKFYQISSSFVATELGTLLTTTGQVSMADNGLQLVLVDGPNGYVWDFTLLTFVRITAAAFLGADMVTYQDGYFIFNKPNSQVFYLSGLKAVTFNGLDIGSSEANPDNLVAILSDHRDLWLFNAQSTEIFFNSGRTSTDANGNLVSSFPFERVQGGFIEQGCAAKFSVAKMNNTVFWLASDDKGQGIVYQAKGYQPQRISTHAVEQAIQSYTTISDAVAFTYQDGGHNFYVLNFPSASTTWVFDSATSLWHERVYTSQGQFQRHRANTHAFAFGKHVVGDYQNGNIYQLAKDAYSDNGSEITRQRVAPHLAQDMLRLYYNSFQLDVEGGTGLDGIQQGTDPQAMLQFSDDGGHTWSNEKWTSLGKIGQTRRRALWRRMGQSRDRVFRITITDPVKVTIIGAELNYAQGAT